MRREITVTINGIPYTETIEHRLLLCDFLRETVGLTGTHVGCGIEGRCGACTVLYDGAAVKSCLMLAVQADGASLLTVEGLAQGADLHPLQKALRDRHGLQCGFCTSGLLMSLCDYLKGPSREPEAIRKAISGNLCRCTGYVHIVQAVLQAINELEWMSAEERARWFPF